MNDNRSCIILAAGKGILTGLLSIKRSQGTGADVMKRIAAPMVGVVVTSFILEALIYPVIFALWKKREVDAQRRSPAGAEQ